MKKTSNTTTTTNNQPTYQNTEFEFHSLTNNTKNKMNKKRKKFMVGQFTTEGNLIHIFNSLLELRQTQFHPSDVYHSMLGNQNKIIVKKQFMFRDLLLSNQKFTVGENYNMETIPFRKSQRKKDVQNQIKSNKNKKTNFIHGNVQEVQFTKIPLISRIKMALGLEIWRKVPIKEVYDHYLISSYGRIKNLSKNRILKNKHHKATGYLRATLYGDNNLLITPHIHRLVALAFIPNPNNYKQVNHIDGIIYNNHYKNLEWVTSQQNMKHYYDQNNNNINPV